MNSDYIYGEDYFKIIQRYDYSSKITAMCMICKKEKGVHHTINGFTTSRTNFRDHLQVRKNIYFINPVVHNFSINPRITLGYFFLTDF